MKIIVARCKIIAERELCQCESPDYPPVLGVRVVVKERRGDNPVVGWRAEVTGYGGQVTGSWQVYPGGQNRRAATLPETSKLLCNP